MPAHSASAPMFNKLYQGDAAETLRTWPDGIVDLVVTSPPYWTAVEYAGAAPVWPTYEAYLEAMQQVWSQCARVLRPNGKLCINAPIMPIPKAIIAQDTRHLKNIAFDMDTGILQHSDMQRYSVFVWQKQTSKMMFGSYPYPGNLLENNTIEFINVYVKPGKPPKFSPAAKLANRISRNTWMDLCQQVWFMYPADIKRLEGHPAPFPDKLPARLIKLYTYGAVQSADADDLSDRGVDGRFPGEVVLDPFVGTGTTCVVAKRLGRRYVGIDCHAGYLAYARERLAGFEPGAGGVPIWVGRGKYPCKAELEQMASDDAAQDDDELRGDTRGKAAMGGVLAAKKHKRRTYGRGASGPA